MGSNSSAPYSFNKNPYTGTYHFDTDHEVAFTVYFALDATWFPSHPHLADHFYTFGFWTNCIGKHDPRVKATLSRIIREHFDHHPDSILTFICDDDDRKQLSRRRKFNGWFLLEAQHQIVKLDKDVLFEGKTKHTSIIMQSKNRYFEIIKEIYLSADADVTGKILD